MEVGGRWGEVGGGGWEEGKAGGRRGTIRMNQGVFPWGGLHFVTGQDHLDFLNSEAYRDYWGLGSESDASGVKGESKGFREPVPLHLIVADSGAQPPAKRLRKGDGVSVPFPQPLRAALRASTSSGV